MDQVVTELDLDFYYIMDLGDLGSILLNDPTSQHVSESAVVENVGFMDYIVYENRDLLSHVLIGGLIGVGLGLCLAHQIFSNGVDDHPMSNANETTARGPANTIKYFRPTPDIRLL